MTQKSTVKVAFIDVGQGDTIIISIPETREAVIVDCVDADAVLSYLEQHDIQYIRGLILTHLHLDHCKDAVKLIDNSKSELNLICERVLFHQPKVSGKIWEKIRDDNDGHSDAHVDEKSKKRLYKDILIGLRRWAQLNRNIYNSLTQQPGAYFPLPEVIEFIHPWEADLLDLIGHGLNDTSGVLKINGSGSSALLTGDLEPTGWEYLKKNHTNLRSDVLKFPHHGAWKDRNPDDLLETVNPSVVVISVGTIGRKYGHPNSHVFKIIAQRPQTRLLCTQVTDQCSSEISQNRSEIIKLFTKQAAETGNFFIEQTGCPCAGTIVIELGQSVRVLQPSLEFHRDQIIKAHFSEQHRCSIV
ncbi:hypothetical protein L0337_05815 [candidate division KSB1 bacterium]|nr:hypothetical protein [candidate division KSB1 bacterium]